MLHFLENPDGLRKIIPDVETVKERLAEKELKVDLYFDRFLDSLAEYAPKVVSALIVLLIGLWLIKRIASIADRTMTRRDLDISLRTFLKSLMSIGLRIILIVTVAGMIGVGTASFVTILGAAGLAVGLALQGSLSNFAGGVLILIFKPFRVGDSIEAGGQSGEVIEIQIFNTLLLTAEHKVVILPNGPLSNGTIVNTTRHGHLRVELELKLSTENDLEKIKPLIYKVLGESNRILTDQPIEIALGRFSEGSMTLFVRAFCLPGNTGALSSDLYENLKKAFESNRVKLALPTK
jgi:small conductance mechanosensitive channel